MKTIKTGILRSTLFIIYFLSAQFIPKAFDHDWNEECKIRLVLINGFFAYGLGSIYLVTFLRAYCRFNSIRAEYNGIERSEKLKLSKWQMLLKLSLFTIYGQGLFWLGMNFAWKESS